MIRMDCYSPEFEECYLETVEMKLDEAIREQIVESCQRFLPECFFGSAPPAFETLVRAPYAKLKAAKKYINNVSAAQMKTECFDPKCKNKSDINDLYILLYNAFTSVMNAQKSKTSMRVRIVNEAGFTVCPYCNRDYINGRGGAVSGAQIDHFFSRSEYPIFAVSLYNLVPVCANCNRVKSDKSKEFASPFDQTIDWENDVKFEYHPKSLKETKIYILSSNKAINNNIEEMHIKDAYKIHEQEIQEILERHKAYTESQKDEIREILKRINITDDEIKRIIFGPKITPESARKKPLGKMTSDIHKELKIY